MRLLKSYKSKLIEIFLLKNKKKRVNTNLANVLGSQKYILIEFIFILFKTFK